MLRSQLSPPDARAPAPSPLSPSSPRRLRELRILLLKTLSLSFLHHPPPPLKSSVAPSSLLYPTFLHLICVQLSASIRSARTATRRPGTERALFCLVLLASLTLNSSDDDRRHCLCQDADSVPVSRWGGCEEQEAEHGRSQVSPPARAQQPSQGGSGSSSSQGVRGCSLVSPISPRVFPPPCDYLVLLPDLPAIHFHPLFVARWIKSRC